MREAEGLFETIRATAGRPTLWHRHLERLTRSARELGFQLPPAPDALEAAVVKALGLTPFHEAVVRLTLVRAGEDQPASSEFRVEVEPLSSRLWTGAGAGACTAILASGPYEPGPFARHKTTRRHPYAPARDEARARGVDEALLSSASGQVLEGTVSNVFAVFGEEIVTPPLTAGILPGIMRALVLEVCRERGFSAREDGIQRERLVAADEVFLTNAVQRVAPIAVLEGQPLPKRAIGLELMQICNKVADGGSERP